MEDKQAMNQQENMKDQQEDTKNLQKQVCNTINMTS